MASLSPLLRWQPVPRQPGAGQPRERASKRVLDAEHGMPVLLRRHTNGRAPAASHPAPGGSALLQFGWLRNGCAALGVETAPLEVG